MNRGNHLRDVCVGHGRLLPNLRMQPRLDGTLCEDDAAPWELRFRHPVLSRVPDSSLLEPLVEAPGVRLDLQDTGRRGTDPQHRIVQIGPVHGTVEDQPVELYAHSGRTRCLNHAVEGHPLVLVQLIREGRDGRSALSPAPGHGHLLRAPLGMHVDDASKLLM